MTAGATTLGIIDTGPTRRGWHLHELILICSAKYAWGKLGPDGATAGLRLAELAALGAPAPAEPLIRGTLMHIGLAHLYEHTRRAQQAEGRWHSTGLVEQWQRQGVKCTNPAATVANLASPSDALEEMIAQYETAWPDCTSGFRSTLRRVLTSYHGYYHELDNERFDIIGVEVVFEDTITDVGPDGKTYSTPFTQRIDLIVRARSTGLIYYFDHKSTHRLGAKVKARYILSGQFLALQYLGRLRHGVQFGGVLPNLVALNPIDFSREPLEAAPYALARWPRDVVYAARLEQVLKSAYGLDPSDWPGSPSELTCMTAYGPCPYFDRCRFGVKPLAEMLPVKKLALEAILDDF